MHKDNRITVLYVHANNRDIGGADYCLFKLAAELDRNVFRPVVCLSEKTEVLDLYKNEGIKTYLIDMERIKKSKNPFYLTKLLLKFIPTVHGIRKIIKQENVNLVHGNDLLDIYGPVAARTSHVPALQHCRMILPKSSILKYLLTHVTYYINNTMVVISEGVRDAMYPFANKTNEPKITVCHDWFDFDSIGHGASSSDIRQELSIDDGACLIGVVGRLEPWKGQHVFLKAANIVAKEFPSAVFLIVGGAVQGRYRENYKANLESMAIQFGISDRVIFTGHRNDISDIMSSLDIFVLSSVTPEPLGQVVMEAGACGKPAIVSDAGGPPEIITHGKTGCLYPIGDHKQLAKNIIHLLKNPIIASQMGVAAKKKIEKSFNKKALSERIMQLYTKLEQTEYSLFSKGDEDR
jgi:glycosyltransferase involved in cell wall biosynthesis